MDFHIIHPVFAANFTFSHKKLSQQAKINIRNHKIRKTILNKESHIKRYGKNLFFAPHIIFSKLDSIIDMIDIFVLQYRS